MAMTIKDYEDRIAKSEDKLVKIDKRIKKWEDNKSDEKFAKEYEWFQADQGWQIGWDGNKTIYGTFEEFKALKYAEWLEECDREIKHANNEKQETLTLINKYKNAISLLQEKDAKPVIQIFRDFFDNWKEEIKEYVKPKVELYYETNTKLTDMYNNKYRIKEMDYEASEAYKAEYKRLHELEKSLTSEPIIRVAIDKRYKWRDDDFNKYLDDYMNDRYFELVDKVTKIVGQIEDVDNLYIGHDGRINGVVKGDQGKAKLETIIAGGYREHEIVNVKHGQCKHYRVLVRPVK
jgi:hypothetical protein